MQAKVIEQGKRGEFASTAHREDCPFCTAYRCGMTFLDVVLKVPFARVVGPFFWCVGTKTVVVAQYTQALW